MKLILSLLLAFCVSATAALADEQTRQVQVELKKQGFYFGEADGNPGNDFSAAVKRFQIRNGLEVTGQVNEETLGAVNGAPDSQPTAPVPQPKPAPVSPPSSVKQTQPRTAPKESVRESDRQALREEEMRPVVPRDRSIVRPPADYQSGPVPQGDYRYRELYESTPFANAPRQLQEQTLRAAQRVLAQDGFYRGVVDGNPGPATEGALLDYQRNRGLRSTGRLDYNTLDALRLLPGPGSENPNLTPFKAPGKPYERRVYRGIWVN